MTPKPQPKKPHNPKHRRVSFRKARLMREAEAKAKAREEMMADVTAISDALFAMTDPRNEEATTQRYDCTRCGKDATEDYLVPEEGMVCEACMTDADLDAWDAHNKLHNPDSYDSRGEEE